jgi:hypothetical protein
MVSTLLADDILNYFPEFSPVWVILHGERVKQGDDFFYYFFLRWFWIF